MAVLRDLTQTVRTDIVSEDEWTDRNGKPKWYSTPLTKVSEPLAQAYAELHAVNAMAAELNERVQRLAREEFEHKRLDGYTLLIGARYPDKIGMAQKPSDDADKRYTRKVKKSNPFLD
jgi:hypothetical protein